VKEIIAGVLTVAATLAVADTKGGDKKKDMPPPPRDAVLVPSGDLKWADVPGFKGIKLAAADGTDPGAGPAHFFLKFVGGFKAPVHHHSAEHYVAVLAGTLILTVDGKDVRLPPGSYFSFTKNKPHATACAAGPDCVLAMDARDKWDVVPEPAPAKK
jgi:mannose-6-phosphate isomerase-like protein (cupin superfamily)